MAVKHLDYKWKVLISVIFGIFMVILDGTVVNVAFQVLREEFHAGLNDSQWILSVYVMSLGISTPLSGFLGDRFGAKRIYVLGLAIFVFGSFLSGIAPNLGFLVAARALQGFGGGIAIPLGTAQLYSAFPIREQGTALGIFGIALVVAPALGPILGGWLVDHNLWRLIFFINIPIGLTGVFLASRFLQESKTEHRPSIDILGLVTSAVGFASILYAASVAATFGWTSGTVIGFFILGAISLVVFAIVELFVAKEPLLNLRLYGKRTFLIASLLGYVSVIGLFGAEFMLPVYLQSLRGRTALQTGLILLPAAFTSGIATPLAGKLYDRIGPRLLVAVGYSMLIMNTWQLSQIKSDTPILFIAGLVAMRGVAVGMTVQSTLATALSVVPRQELSRAASLVNATRQVVQSIGVALLATILASTLSPQVKNLEQQFQNAPVVSGASQVALCETSSFPTATDSTTPPLAAAGQASAYSSLSSPAGGQSGAKSFALAPAASDPPSGGTPANAPGVGGIIQQACDQSVAGFERAYTVTFLIAVTALLLGLLMPGWPGKWNGRSMAGPTPVGH